MIPRTPGLDATCLASEACYAFTAQAREDVRCLALSTGAVEALHRTCAGLAWPPRARSLFDGLVPDTACAWCRPQEVGLRDTVVVYREATGADRRAVADGVRVVVARVLTNQQLAALGDERAAVAVIDAMNDASSPTARRLRRTFLLHRRR